ncbi:MAG TPA: TA system VapC family ribonuclease toxin [Acidimicrobiales bacterium]|nr:TA system VapC family ribonuclease toxin [Acidimicrobiales bacterium]
MLIDANILLYAVDEQSPFHDAARLWLESALNGPRRVGIPWMSLVAFVRIATHSRALADPMSPSDAWQQIDDWLDAGAAWVPQPGRGHREILGRLIRDLDLHGNLISDAVLCALCIEHGLQMVSADSDFARFTEIVWINPIA